VSVCLGHYITTFIERETRNGPVNQTPCQSCVIKGADLFSKTTVPSSAASAAAIPVFMYSEGKKVKNVPKDENI